MHCMMRGFTGKYLVLDQWGMEFQTIQQSGPDFIQGHGDIGSFLF